VIFDGRNGGIVELLENVLVIRRKGVASFLTQGLKGEKRIPYSSITSVQFKDAGFTTGYIQFGLAGGIESRRGVWDATSDENTVLFTKQAAEEFRRLRDIVEDRAAAARGGKEISRNSAPPANISEELTRLADLRDRGVLTEEEFAEQKTHLLGKSREGSQSTAPSPIAATATSSPRSRAGTPTGPIAEPPKNKVGRVVGIGCLAVVGLFIVLAAIGSQVEQTNTAVDAPQAGAGSAASDNPATPPAELPIAVTATELFQAYDNNEASAQGYFGSRKLLVSGTVDKVTLDFMDDPVVGLRTPNQFMSAQAALADDAKSEAGNLNPGDKVKLLCADISEVAGIPMLKDCRTAPAGMKSQPVQWSNR